MYAADNSEKFDLTSRRHFFPGRWARGVWPLRKQVQQPVPVLRRALHQATQRVDIMAIGPN